MKINILKLNPNAILPSYGSEFAAGADLYACIDDSVTINPGETFLIHTGIATEIPVGYAGLIYARSGLATKHGLAPANKVGVVDSDYRGEVMVSLFNHGSSPVTVSSGDRVAQLVITPVVTAEFTAVDSLGSTVRGSGGFGSTGKN